MPGTTPNYSIKYPLATENIRRQQLEDLAKTADTALHQAVTDAGTAGAAAASPFADNARQYAADAAAYADDPLMLMGA